MRENVYIAKCKLWKFKRSKRTLVIKTLTSKLIMKILITLIILLSIRLLTFGQDDMRSGIIYGNNYAFSLTAPEGWVLDNKSGVNQGLYAVFYEKGSSWDKATTVMYANTASFRDKEHRNLDKLIQYDMNVFKKNYPDVEFTDCDNIVIKENVIAKVKYLSGKSYSNFEAMAYIDAGKTGVMIVMSSRTKEGFNNSLNAFESLVKSYLFITSEVKIENKK